LPDLSCRYTIREAPLTSTVPEIPVEVPSTLLERNPGIAAAERQMQVESALIGVAVGAYVPQITLSALGGYAGDPLSQLFNIGNNRSAAVRAARATYDQYIASYRQTVLSGFQQVEDELLALRVLRREGQFQSEAVKSAQTAASVTLIEALGGGWDTTQLQR
jgi:outer membrane protein TolC